MATAHNPQHWPYHSRYKGCDIMFNDGPGYWVEVKGAIAHSTTLAGIRRHVSSLLSAPIIDWRTL